MIRTIFFRFYVSLVGLSFLGRFLCIVLVIVVAFLVVQCYRLLEDTGKLRNGDDFLGFDLHLVLWILLDTP